MLIARVESWGRCREGMEVSWRWSALRLTVGWCGNWLLFSTLIGWIFVHASLRPHEVALPAAPAASKGTHRRTIEMMVCEHSKRNVGEAGCEIKRIEISSVTPIITVLEARKSLAASSILSMLQHYNKSSIHSIDFVVTFQQWIRNLPSLSLKTKANTKIQI